jgi:hypothetical protein
MMNSISLAELKQSIVRLFQEYLQSSSSSTLTEPIPTNSFLLELLKNQDTILESLLKRTIVMIRMKELSSSSSQADTIQTQTISTKINEQTDSITITTKSETEIQFLFNQQLQDYRLYYRDAHQSIETSFCWDTSLPPLSYPDYQFHQSVTSLISPALKIQQTLNKNIK